MEVRRSAVSSSHVEPEEENGIGSEDVGKVDREYSAVRRVDKSLLKIRSPGEILRSSCDPVRSDLPRCGVLDAGLVHDLDRGARVPVVSVPNEIEEPPVDREDDRRVPEVRSVAADRRNPRRDDAGVDVAETRTSTDDDRWLTLPLVLAEDLQCLGRGRSRSLGCCAHPVYLSPDLTRR